jgi:inorganic triphosphatase YgiF
LQLPDITERSIMTAPVEVELKLELPAAALRQFRKLAWIRALAGSAKRSTPVSVYFDTDKQKLRRRGITLRVRRSGDRYIQTIKATGHSGIVARNEWESEIADGQPDRAQARGTALDDLLTDKFWRKLKPQFETRVRRTVFPLERNGAMIELSLDEGTIETGDASMRLCEIELELKSGDTRVAASARADQQIGARLPPSRRHPGCTAQVRRRDAHARYVGARRLSRHRLRVPATDRRQ